MSKTIFIDPYYTKDEQALIDKLNSLEIGKWFKIHNSPNYNQILYLLKSMIAMGEYFELNSNETEVRQFEPTDELRTVKIKKGTIIPFMHNGKVYREPMPNCYRTFRGKKLIEIG